MQWYNLSSSSPSHKAATRFLHSCLSFAFFSAVPQVRLALRFPCGVHLSAILGMFSGGILKTWPNHLILRRLISVNNVFTLCNLVEIIVGDDHRPKYLTDLSEMPIVHVCLCDTPTFRSIACFSISGEIPDDVDVTLLESKSLRVENKTEIKIGCIHGFTSDVPIRHFLPQNAM